MILLSLLSLVTSNIRLREVQYLKTCERLIELLIEGKASEWFCNCETAIVLKTMDDVIYHA